MSRQIQLYLFIALIAAYIGLSLGLPADPASIERFNISELQLRLLQLTVVVPITFVWFAALYGFMRFKDYAKTVVESREGNALNQVANGLMVLAYGLPLASVIGAYLRYLGWSDPSLADNTTILRNYVTLAFALISFALIARGATNLLKTLRDRPVVPHPPFLTAALLTLAAMFTWLVLSSAGANDRSSVVYHLSDRTAVFTIVIPYLIAWYQGSLGAYVLYVYRDKVRGTLYKQAFKELSQGIGIVVGISVIGQLITALSVQLVQLKLTPILGILYLLLVLYAVGFGLVARGASKLKRIEEV